MRIAFALLALLGFCLSMVAHVATLLGVDVREHVPLVWLLHLGVFVVAVPMISAMRKWKSRSFLTTLLRGLPVWARAFTISLGVYTILNFIVCFAAAADGQAAEKDHRYVLQDGSRFVRELTVEEYHSRRAMEIRGFSGHWMAFYFLAFAVLVLHEEAPDRRNPLHRVSHVRPE